MDIQLHKKTILKWIKTSETSEQLKISEQAIEYFISERFEKLVAPLDLAMVEADLLEAIKEKEIEIALSNTTALPIAPTLERNSRINDII